MREDLGYPNQGAEEIEKHELGDVCFLFDKENPDLLAQRIEAAGYEVSRDGDEDGERITEVIIPQGEHVFSFGFRQIDTKEQRWFHGGLDNKEKREDTPFTFDVQSPDFKRVKSEFLSSLEKNDTLETNINKLDKIIQFRVKSDMGNEDAHSLSEILQSGKAACASKSVLVGSILRECRPDLRVESVYGYYGVMENKISLPFGHEWLRVSDGVGAVLYDPMYGKKFYYPFDTIPKEDNPFSQYTVAALPFAKLHGMIKLTAMSESLKVIESYDGAGNEFVVDNSHTSEAQLGGQLTALVRVNGGVLRLVNGNISNEVNNDGPRLLYPLLHIGRNS
jgi:hypothetical protein